MRTVELGTIAGPQALLERAAQLATLQSSLAEAAAGRGRLVLVYGEAGVGKTALVRQFCADANGPDLAFWARATPCRHRGRSDHSSISRRRRAERSSRR